MSKQMPRRFKLKIGASITVKRSKLLGTPAERGKIVELVPREPCYVVRFDNDPDTDCEIDADGVVLMGPPYRGKLVRAE